jgi:flagellar basal-body rod protein FlgB
MIDPLFQSDSFQLARKLLDGSALRQQAIAANIANAETPGYRRVDLSPDFQTQLQSEFQTGADSDALDSLQPKLVEDASARSVRPDGNSVDLERELLSMDRNSVDYSYLTEVVSHNIKQLKIAISGQPG